MHIWQSIIQSVYYLYFIAYQDLQSEEGRIGRKKRQRRQLKIYEKTEDQETGKRAMSY